MSILNGQWIELFRAGNYGEKGDYTPADIDKMVANYDPAKHEAPVVMGHPEHDAPAYGWVEQLRRAGNVLMGKLKQVPAQFEDLVRSGRFKKRSISFYKTENGPSLRHVGFLGAMPPEVKGLADVKLAHFSVASGLGVAIEFTEEEDVDAEQTKRSFMDSLREFFSEYMPKKNKDTDDQAEAMETALAALTTKFEAKFSELSTQVTNEKTAREKAERSAATQSQAAFADTQIKRVKEARRWVPAFDKMGLVQIFAELAKSEAKVSFGEGDKKTEKPAAEAFADFMIALSQIVPTGEIAGGSVRRTGNLVQFNEPIERHTAVDQNSVALAEAATALSRKEKIPYGEALQRVRSEGDYAGAAASGAV